MLNDAQLLAALSEWLSPGEIAQVLQRILRVPEAWNQMHDPAFLNRIREAQLPSPFTASQLGRLTLGLDGQCEISLPEDVLARQESVWHRALHAVPPDPDLEGVHLLALALVEKAVEAQGPERLASFVLAAPRTWRSPLACAWMHLPASTKTLSGLLSADQPQGIMLAANSLLANLSPKEAAKLWLAAQPNPAAGVYLTLQNLGEVGLASALSELCDQNEHGARSLDHPNGLEGLLSLAARKHVEHKMQTAHDVLDQAWSEAVKSTSIVAEQLAELAQAEGDPVLAVEARQQALNAEPTPLRRAWLAMALLELDRTEDALSSLPDHLHCAEEQIAAGLIRLKLDQRSQAAEILREALRSSGEMDQHDGRWLYKLSEGLKACGDIGGALVIARQRISLAPCDLNARITLAKLLAEAGDREAAAQEAYLNLALSPESKEARRSLAQRLLESGQSTAALAHWQALAEDDPAFLPDLVTCALGAGEIELARQSAHSAVTNLPEDAATKVLYARALIASGDIIEARTYLDQAIESNAHTPEAWLALAESYAISGESDAEGSTLASAVQAAPEHGSLHIAHAIWLQTQGRLSEALQAAEKAVNLEPDRTDWLLLCSQLLSALGHKEQVISILQRAFSLQPANWEVRRRLAEEHEASDDIETAWSFLGHVPADQDAYTHLLAGRIAVRIAMGGDESALAPGIGHLETARSLGLPDPELHYWLGTAYNLVHRATEGIQEFQACIALADEKTDLHRNALIGLARCQTVEGHGEEAVATLEAGLTLFPADPEVLIEMAGALLIINRAERSLIIAQQVLDIDPESEIGLLQLARSAEEAERLDMAVAALEKIAQQKPDDALAWLQLARVALTTGDITLTRNAIARAATLDRKDVEVLFECAALLIDMGNTRLAQRMIQRAITFQPENVSLLSIMANLAQKNHDPEAARHAWSSISDLDPDNGEAQYQAGLAFWEMNLPTEAIEHWRKALDLIPENADVHAALGRALTKTGEYELGLNHLSSAMKLSPDDAEITLETGSTALRSGRPEEAAEILQRAVRLAPERTDAVEALGKCLLDLDRPKEAHEVLKRVCIQSEAPPSAHALRAVAALHTGDIQGSEQALADAISMTPKTTEDAITFAQAAASLGHWSDALRVSKEWTSESKDSQALLAHARLCLRIADAHWLFSIQGEASVQGPDAETLEHVSIDSFNSLLDQSSRGGVAEADIEMLRLRHAAASPSATEEILAALDAQLSLRSDLEAAEGLAIAYLRAGRHDQARQVLRVQFANETGAGWARILNGIALAQDGQDAQSRKAFEQSSDDPAIRPLAQFLLSRTLINQGELDGAIKALNVATAGWPNVASWHYRLALLYAEQGDPDIALPHFQQAAELDPSESDYPLALARNLRELGQSTAAASAFAKVIKTQPEDGPTWSEAGEAALASGNIKRAQEWFERACTISPSDAASLMGSARAYQALGNLREAEDRAQAALRLAPQDPNVLMGLGEILASRGQFEKAIRTYDQALNSTKDPIAVHLRRSDLMIKLGRAPQAVEHLIEIVRHEPDDDRIWATLTNALEIAGDMESAMEAATRAVRLAPRNAAYRLALGRVSRKSGHLDRAIGELTQAEAIAPSEAEIATELGNAYLDRRELTHALDAFQRALSLDPDHAPAHFGKAMAHKELKNYKDASDELGKALDLNPNDAEAHQQLAAVRALTLIHGGALQMVE